MYEAKTIKAIRLLRKKQIKTGVFRYWGKRARKSKEKLCQPAEKRLMLSIIANLVMFPKRKVCKLHIRRIVLGNKRF